MKKAATLVLLIFWFSSPATGGKRDDFALQLTLVTGERSRDSHSETRNFTLTGNTLVYAQTYSGYGADRRKPIQREYKLKGSEMARLKSLIKEKNLLGSGHLEFTPAPGQFTYFEMNIKITLDGIISTQELSGPRSALKIKEENVYRKAVALVQELYRIINLRDKELSYREPVS